MYSDQDFEAGINSLADGGQNRAAQVRYLFEIVRANLAGIVVPNGARFRFGSGPPAAALGLDGDVYDNILTGDRSQKVTGAWVFQYNAKGANGTTPRKGIDYTDGYTPRKGVDYRDGIDGKSAYQIWLDAGNTGMQAAFLASLKGAPASTAPGAGSYWHQESYDPASTDGQDGEFWQTAVSLSTERRFKKVTGTWRKYYDNTGVAVVAPGPVTVPGAPTSVTATLSGNNVVVNGTAPASNGGAAVSGYAVYRSGTLLAASVSLPYTDTTAAAGSSPSYTLAALNSAGQGPQSVASNQVTIPVPANQIPTASAGSNATIQLPTNQIALMGSATDPDAGDTFTYAWRQVTGPVSVSGMPATVQNPVATGLTTAGTYQFGLIATDQLGGHSAEVFTVVTVQAAAMPNALGVAVAGQSLASGLARQIDRTAPQKGPFAKTLMHNDDTNTEQPLQLGINATTGALGNECGLNGGLSGMPPRADGASVPAGLENYYDGFGAERRFAERLQASGHNAYAYLKLNVEHPVNTNGSSMAYWKTTASNPNSLFELYKAQYNRQRANYAAQGKNLVITHFLWNQGQAEVSASLYPNAPGNVNPNFVADLNSLMADFKALFNNPNLKIQVARSRGATNQYNQVGLYQVQYVGQEPAAVLYDDPSATYLPDGVHDDANSKDREGDFWYQFVTGDAPLAAAIPPPISTATSGQFVYSSGFSADGSVWTAAANDLAARQATPASRPTAGTGAGLVFDGTKGLRIDPYTTSAFSSFGFLLKAALTATAASQHLFTQTDLPQGTFQSYWYQGVIYFRFHYGTYTENQVATGGGVGGAAYGLNYADVRAPFAGGVLELFAGITSGGTLYLRVNGTLTTGTATVPASVPFRNDQINLLCENADNITAGAVGTLANVRLYNHALSPSECASESASLTPAAGAFYAVGDKRDDTDFTFAPATNWGSYSPTDGSAYGGSRRYTDFNVDGTATLNKPFKAGRIRLAPATVQAKYDVQFTNQATAAVTIFTVQAAAADLIVTVPNGTDQFTLAIIGRASYWNGQQGAPGIGQSVVDFVEFLA